jgi:probable rRNA maturation factor
MRSRNWKMIINIDNQSRALKKVPARPIQRIARTIASDERRNRNPAFLAFLNMLRGREPVINIRFVDNARMRSLNRKYFNRDRVTDVIAFSMIEGARVPPVPPQNTLGDIIINAQAAFQDCGRYGQTFLKELLLLVIHSLLHVMGHDHPGPNSSMRKRERTYLDRLTLKERTRRGNKGSR